MKIRVLLLLLALHPALWAREKLALKMEVHPSEAVLRINQQRFQADQGVYYLNRENLPGNANQSVEFVFQAEHFQDQSLSLSWNQLKDGEYPAVVELKIASWTGFSQRYPVVSRLLLVMLGGVLLAQGFQFIRHRRDSARLKQLNRLLSDSQAPDPLLNTLLGRYRLISHLGSGGMASVYRGIPEENLDEKLAVAIKVIRTTGNSADFTQRFLREIAISMKLNHPGMVRILDSGEQNGLCFMVMELVEGQPLSKLIPEGGLAWSEARESMTQIVEALLHAHELGIIHRDIKPENMLVTPRGRIQLMDFGLARTHDTKTLTATGNALGTPPYMAPEQLSKTSHYQDLTAQSDQYSLGVTFFELLTGRRPFVHEEPFRVMMMHVQEPPPKLRSLRPDLPEWLEEMVGRMLEKEPEARYSSLREIRDRLNA